MTIYVPDRSREYLPFWADQLEHPNLIASFRVESIAPAEPLAPRDSAIRHRAEMTDEQWRLAVADAQTPMDQLRFMHHGVLSHTRCTWVSHVWLQDCPDSTGIALDMPEYIRDFVAHISVHPPIRLFLQRPEQLRGIAGSGIDMSGPFHLTFQ